MEMLGQSHLHDWHRSKPFITVVYTSVSQDSGQCIRARKGSVLAFHFIPFSASAGSEENVYIKRNIMKSKTQNKAPETEFTQNKDHSSVTG